MPRDSDSIAALREFMDDLGVEMTGDFRQTRMATVTNLDKGSSVQVEVTFCTDNGAPTGPFMEFGDDVADLTAGLGIPYKTFRPNFGGFTYDSESGTLTVSGTGFRFSVAVP